MRLTDKPGLAELLQLCCEINQPETMQQLFELFFTDEEQKALGHRYLIIRELLLEKKTQREVAREFGISIAKITRGSNALKRSPQGFKNILREHYHAAESS